MRLTHEQARQLIIRTLLRHKLSPPDAEVTADALVEAELRGRPTHGLMRVTQVTRACDDVRGEPPAFAKAPADATASTFAEATADKSAGKPRLPAGKPALVTGRGAVACLDGHGHLGYVVCRRAAEEAGRRAERHGFGLVAARNTRHMGMLGYYVDLLARRGQIGLAFADCRPLVAPFGGINPVLGTNPIAAAFPWQPHPILLDVGTSAATFGEVLLARGQGRPLPEGVALDKDGQPTTDPKRAAEGALLPWAGHKGYVFGLLAQLLAGALTQAGGLPTRGDDYGMLILAMRTDLFGDAAGYEAEVTRLVHAIRASRRRPGVSEILLPGERAYRERDRRLREGLEISDALYREIETA